MTTLELQSLYTRLGTCRAVARHLHMSTDKISTYLRDRGVKVNRRGGDWKKMPRHAGHRIVKIEHNRLANEAAGDPSYRAAPVSRELCRHGITCEGVVKPCCMATDGHCTQCLAEHSINAYSGNGASSSWIDPSHGGRGRRIMGHQREAR